MIVAISIKISPITYHGHIIATGGTRALPSNAILSGSLLHDEAVVSTRAFP